MPQSCRVSSPAYLGCYMESKLPRLSGKSSALSGYACGAKRAWQLTSAVWGAGAREQIRLNPVIVFTRGHALAGPWMKPEELTTALVDDVTAVRKRVKLRELVFFESTLVTQNHASSFSDAVERGTKQIAEDTDSDLEMLLDIRRARLQRIKPLASSEAQIACVALEMSNDLPAHRFELGLQMQCLRSQCTSNSLVNLGPVGGQTCVRLQPLVNELREAELSQ